VPELDHPEKLFPIIFILFIILIVTYMRKMGERKMDTGTSYLGSAHHLTSMTESIEESARRVIAKYPQLDDKEHARMVRDELRLLGIVKVDMYEATIFTTIARIKSGAVPPPPPPLPPPPRG
jgi:hypothetical protein